jgi:hypothetical protein
LKTNLEDCTREQEFTWVLGDLRDLRGSQGVLCGDFLLFGILTIEQKTGKHKLEETLFGLSSTLFPTVHHRHYTILSTLVIIERKMIIYLNVVQS